MANENYGCFGELVESVAQTPVSTDTFIYFIGTSSGGELNKAHLVTSMSDYINKFDGEIGDGYSLTEAAIAAFNVAGLNRVYMIPIAHYIDTTSSDYMGDASLFTGIYALEAQLRDNPTATNIVCLPGMTDSSVLQAVLGICKKAAGHWDSFLVYDMPFGKTHTNAAGYAQVSAIVHDKQISDEQAKAVWGSPVIGGEAVSGAAIQACLMAKSDASYGVPARCGGNLPVSGMQSICGVSSETVECDQMSGGAGGTSAIQDLKVDTEFIEYDDSLSYNIVNINTISGSISNPALVNHDGKLALRFAPPSSGTYQVVVTYEAVEKHKIIIPEASGTQLSADGVCSWINYSGQFCTWGDHTSAFNGGTVTDERARFDNSIRMLMMIINRFQMKYRFSIDDPMTLSMRNDVIDEEITYMFGLVALGGLIGEPICEFRSVDNGVDQLAQGYFTWSIQATPTIPAKFMNLKVAYSQAGLSVYTAEAA
jgi:hypothetical protein